jgi:hypothetical protein
LTSDQDGGVRAVIEAVEHLRAQQSV